MNELSFLTVKFFRFVLTMVGFALGTTVVLLAVVPDISKPGAVTGAIVVALLVAMYDGGLFKEELTL